MTDLMGKVERRVCPCCGGVLIFLFPEPLGEYGKQAPELTMYGTPGVCCTRCHRSLSQIVQELECRKA